MCRSINLSFVKLMDWATGAISILLIAGCASHPPQQIAPLSELTSSVAAGTPLAPALGPSTTQTRTGDMARVEVAWIGLRKLPDHALTPIDAYASLTIAPLSGESVLSSGRATRPVRFGEGNAVEPFLQAVQRNTYGPWVDIARASGLVATNTTRRFELRTNDASAAAPQVAISISPIARSTTTQPTTQVAQAPGSTAMLALEITGTGPATTGSSDGRVPSLLRETALIDSLPYDTDSRYVVVVPLVFMGTPWTAAVGVVKISRIDATAEERQALAAELKQSADSIPTTASAGMLSEQTALDSLTSGDSPRASLLFLTGISHADIATDYVLAGDRAAINRLATQTSIMASAAAPPLPQLQWFLDRTTLQWMCEAAVIHQLPPELFSVLAIHTGDLAHRPDEVLGLLKSVQSSDELNQRLIAENYIALEDNSPSVRVTAYDWLKTRNSAPAGFDPLGDGKARRAAIDRAVNP
jgi:hypothetical protein